MKGRKLRSKGGWFSRKKHFSFTRIRLTQRAFLIVPFNVFH